MWAPMKRSSRVMVHWMLVAALFQQASAGPTTTTPSPPSTSSIVMEAANAALSRLTTLAPPPTPAQQAPTTAHPQHHLSTHSSPKPQVISVHKLHKHINKGSHNGTSDKLHKFDLFIDPVCEQLPHLTDKQMDRVFSQLSQLSKHVS